MTDSYKKRLVKLASEIHEMSKPIQVNENIDVNEQWENHDRLFRSKLNYLLGYIMALEDNDRA